MIFFRFGIVTLCLLAISLQSFAIHNGFDVKLVRKKMVLAIDSSPLTDSLYNSLTQMGSKQPLVTAYIATLDALKAKHTWNPYFKLRYLNLSEKQMDNAVVADPHNIEIRFMRFSIQHNVPAFLGYGKNLVDDRKELLKQLELKNYGTADKELTESIIRFLIASKRCTPGEYQKLMQYLAAL